MIPSIFSFEIINVVFPDPKSFFQILGSAAGAAAGNPNGTKMFFTNDLSKFLNEGKTVFSNGRISIPENPPDCTILDNSVLIILY